MFRINSWAKDSLIPMKYTIKGEQFCYDRYFHGLRPTDKTHEILVYKYTSENIIRWVLNGNESQKYSQ